MGLIVVLEIVDDAGFQFVVEGSEDAAMIVCHGGILELIAVASEVTPHQFDDVGRDTMGIWRIETRKIDGLVVKRHLSVGLVSRNGRSMRLLVEPGMLQTTRPCLLLLD
jgi:hypothetical protein